jgi:outer membrane protein
MRVVDQAFLRDDGLKRLARLERSRIKRKAGGEFLALACLFLSLLGCISMKSLTSRTSPSPQVPWTPPPEVKQPPVLPAPVQIPPELLQSEQNLTLVNLIDIGLLNNPQTREAWAEARSASAGLDIARSSYLPDISVEMNGAKTKGAAIGGRFVFDYTSLNMAANLSFLLFDFGGRKAGLDMARQALAAANWTQNSVIQNVVLQIEQDYYQYLAAKALLKAYEVNLKEAEANLDAASERRKAGVATIAEVLQAKTAFSQTQLNLVSTQGLIQSVKGALASAMGLPANASFEVADELPTSLPLDQVSGDVERFIGEAQSKRPDLAAARSQVLLAEAHIRAVRAEGLPTVEISGNVGKTYFNTAPKPSSSLSASVLLNIPLTLAWANRYQVLQAEANAQTAKAQMEKISQNIILQVWTSYYNVMTAAQRIKTAQDLNDAAQESYQVALASYKEGVGSILDLLSAQSSLENGRVQLIQAKTDWLLSLAQFAHDTGTLELPEKPSPGAVPIQTEKGENLP